jgi:hypothetical protein
VTTNTDPAQPTPVSRDTHHEAMRRRVEKAEQALGWVGTMGEASEDTEPARCQACGVQRVSMLHDPAYGGHEFVPAPASDDEMTPGPSVTIVSARRGDSPHHWIVQFSDGTGAAVVHHVPAWVEAAIRAPLERSLENAHEAARETLMRQSEALAAVTAERDMQ